MNRSIRVLACLFVLVLSAVRLHAQPAPGTPQFGSFAGGPDVIDLGNLNTHIAIPIINKAGRGTNFTYDLSYDNSIWYPVTSGSTTTWQPVANWGWRAETEVAVGYISYQQSLFQPPGCTQVETVFTNFAYHDEFGMTHGFGGIMLSNHGCFWPTSGSLVAVDGSGLTMSASDATGTLTASLVTKYGQNIYPPLQVGTGSATATDRNGNQITVDSSGNFYDTLSSSTSVLTATGLGTPTNPVKFKYTAPSGTLVYYQINYTNFTVATNFGNTTINEYKSSAAVPLVTSIDLPDGSQYTFTYEATPTIPAAGQCTAYPNTTCVTGRIASVTYPTLGAISYLYYNANNNFAACTTGNNGVFSDGSASCLLRTTPDGTWTYTRTQGTGAASTTTIAAPKLSYDSAANQTVIKFQGIYETNRVTNQGASSALQTTNTCYNGAASPCTGTAITLPIAQRAVIDQYGSSGVQCKHTYFYDSYNNLMEQDDYDYGSGAPGALLRKEIVSYSSLGNNLKAFRQTLTICNGTGSSSACTGASGSSIGTVVAETNYNYDEGTLTASSGVVQHTSISGSRGNLTSINYPVSGLTSHLTYYDTGSINTSQDVNAATTTYTYSSNTADCMMAFPTGITEPISGLTKSMSWNCTGGVMTGLTDENSKTTSIAYSDPYFWRPASVTDQTNVTTNLTYSGQTSAEAVLSNSGSSSVDGLLTLDKLGRTLVHQGRQAPGGTTFDSVETDYDALGRSTRTTLPYSAGAGQTSAGAPAVVTQYDALNRPTLVKDADLGTVSYTYVNNDVLVAVGPAPSGENTKSRVLEYDSLGRLTSVCEVTAGSGTWPGGTCGQNYSPQQTGYWAQYSYDALGDLLTVTQNAQSSTNHQTRTYGFDAMGRITLEKNPETSQTAVTYTYDSDATCGTYKGDLVKKVDAVGNVICAAYDAIHRSTAVTYPSGSYASVTPARHFVYDSATVDGTVMGNTKGKLAEAYTCSSCPSSKITDLGFSYTARGEISDEYQTSPNSAGWYHASLTYWPNGVLHQLSGLPTVPTLTYGVDSEGRTNTISASTGQNPLTGTTYNTASLPTAVTLGSGDSDGFSYDPNTNRMTQYQFNIGAQSFVGKLSWNTNGTLASQQTIDPFNNADNQTCNYTHDDLVRIASVNCGASVWQQNFSYDVFGNLAKTVPTGGTGMSFQPTYSSTTNQIISLPGCTPTYDASGNSLNNCSHTYTWNSDGDHASVDGIGLSYDALGRMIELAYPSEVFYLPGGSQVLFKGQVAHEGIFRLPGGVQAFYDSTQGGLLLYAHADHLGSLRLTSTPTQSFSTSIAYAPFGEEYAPSNSNAQGNAAFTGWGSGFGFDEFDFPAREYMNQGRWVSPDPAGLAAVDPATPQSWNRYAYVLNSPLNMVDPYGEWTCPSGYSEYCNLAARDVGAGGLFFGVTGATGNDWDEFDMLSLAFSDSDCPNDDCALSGMPLYGNTLEAIGTAPPLPPPPPAGGGSQPTACQTKVLNALNAQFGTNLTGNNILPNSSRNPQSGGQVNVDIGVFSGLTPAQFNAIQPGRYAPPGVFGFLTGYGPSLHVVTAPSSLDPNAYAFSNSNIGGAYLDIFTAHIDSAWADNPIGALLHWIIDVLGNKTRNPCP